MTRWAVPEDAEALADVHIATWQKAYEGILPSDFLTGLDRRGRVRFWNRQLRRGARVSVTGNPVAGFCYAGDSEAEGWGEIYAIYVRPEHWGEGLGHALFVAGQDHLRDRGHDRALLWVLRDNRRARDFYERQGWSVGRPIRVEDIGGIQVTEVRYETDL